MLDKFINFIYNFDVIGPSPKLYIFNKERYKNIFSLIISFIIIIVALIFIIYSLVNYIKNERPNVVYSKSNDMDEQRKIYLKDMLLMVQIMDNSMKKLNESFGYLEGVYTAIYDIGAKDYSFLTVEKCIPGKNLNIKYENFLRKKINELSQKNLQDDKNIEDFYCISNQNSDINLFYNPEEGYSYIDLNIILRNQSLYKPEDLIIMVIYENNLINHDNKISPITEGMSYVFLQDFSSDDFYITNINFQYLKYETDEGLFFDSFKYLKGISFLDMNSHKSHTIDYDLQKNFIENNSSSIGTISFALNKSNYDLYRRTYKKLQALIAEIMSILSILFEIGRQIIAFINEKKMNVDIITQLFEINNKKRNKRKFNFSKNNNSNNSNNKIQISSEILNNGSKLSEKNSISIETYDNINEEQENKSEKILRKINIFNVLKSFVCNGNKDKLISLCDMIIIKDMCVEKILERFYSLGNIYKLIKDKEQDSLCIDKDMRFITINSIINEINEQIIKPDQKNSRRQKT